LQLRKPYAIEASTRRVGTGLGVPFGVQPRHTAQKAWSTRRKRARKRASSVSVGFSHGGRAARTARLRSGKTRAWPV